MENSLSCGGGGPVSVPLNCLGVDRLVLAEGWYHYIQRNIYNRAGKAKGLLLGQHYMLARMDQVLPIHLFVQTRL